MHVDMCVCVCTETVLNDQGLVCHVQLLTKSDRTIIITNYPFIFDSEAKSKPNKHEKVIKFYQRFIG